MAEFDLAAHVERSRRGPCFVCAYLDRHPDYEHELIYADDYVVAFLSRYPTLLGYTIVAPRAHVVDVTGDRELFRRVTDVVHDVAEALKATLPTERVYLMSLGSHQGNAHVHWHVAPLPPGVPYERQQFFAVMAENGVLELARDEQANLGARVRGMLLDQQRTKTGRSLLMPRSCKPISTALGRNAKMMTVGKTHYASRLAVATYDLFHSGTDDVPFYLDCARRFGGPILELGLGTGRILIALAQAGYQIVGVELSASMLEVASAKIGRTSDIAARIRLVESDMKNFSVQQRFALALIPARAFQFLLTPLDQRAALTCIRRHLVPGGHLVIDLFDPNFEVRFTSEFTHLFLREVQDPQSGHRFIRSVVARHEDRVLQTFEETLRIEKFDSDGTLIDSEESCWSLRWTMRQEMAYLFELCGFEPIEQYSDFHGSAPAYGREQLWVARATR